MQIIHAERIGREGRLMLGCSAAIMDERGHILLTERTDNGRWCLPGGAFDPGESVSEAVCREVWEETGLKVEVERLIGVYSNPNTLIRYADGNQYHLVSLHFAVNISGGKLGLSNETTAWCFVGREELEQYDIVEHHLQRIADSWQQREATFIR